MNNVFGNAASDLTLNGGNLQVESGRTLNLAQAGNLAEAGVLAKTGASTLLIQTANTGVGAGSTLGLQAGMLEIRNSQALGSTNRTVVALAGGNLALADDAAASLTADSIVQDTLIPGHPGHRRRRVGHDPRGSGGCHGCSERQPSA